MLTIVLRTFVRLCDSWIERKTHPSLTLKIGSRLGWRFWWPTIVRLRVCTLIMRNMSEVLQRKVGDGGRTYDWLQFCVQNDIRRDYSP